MTKIFDPEQSYTFRKVFELKAPVDDITNEFSNTLERKQLNLFQYSGELDDIDY